MTFPANFYIDTVAVSTYLGRGARGDSYAAPVNISCYVDDDRRLVLGTEGAEVVSETTIYTKPANLALFTSGTLVAIGTTTCKVIAVHNRHNPVAPDINHLEIALT